MAGGGKGGLWKAQRVPAEPWHMGQYGYNQVTSFPPAQLPPLHAQQEDMLPPLPWCAQNSYSQERQRQSRSWSSPVAVDSCEAE